MCYEVNMISKLYGMVIAKHLPEDALTGIRLSSEIYLKLREELREVDRLNNESDILKLFGLQVTVDPYLKENEVVFECRTKVLN